MNTREEIAYSISSFIGNNSLIDFFVGSVAISENAINQEYSVLTSSASSLSSKTDPGFDVESINFNWYQQVSLWVSPLH